MKKIITTTLALGAFAIVMVLNIQTIKNMDGTTSISIEALEAQAQSLGEECISSWRANGPEYEELMDCNGTVTETEIYCGLRDISEVLHKSTCVEIIQ